jgi:Ca-activated chloride channel homolog
MTLSSLFSSRSPSPYRMNCFDENADDAARAGGCAELLTSDGRVLPLVRAALRVDAGGGLARVVLEQTFENPHAEVLRVTYKMPLPADGAVSGYEFSIGGRSVKGRVELKETAREQFEQAIADGRTAALLDQQRADVFTQEIGNIPPGETIIARITVDQRLLWLPEGEWELRFPTVIGPRYVGAEDTAAEARAVAVTVAPSRDVGARIHLELDVRDELARGRNVESPSHAIVRPGNGPCLLAALEGSRLDRDIVVRWAVAGPEVGASLSVARPSGDKPHAHVAYGLVTVTPPAPDAELPALPRDLIVLVDTSGSMSGAPLDQAKRVVAMLVESLGDRDRIELIEFSSSPRAWQREPLPATALNKKSAASWVKGLSAGGATEMYGAIVEGLRALRPGAQRQVVLVTDGYIGGENRIVELLHERLPADCRLHVVGVGSAVNRTLAISLARAGRGAEVLVGLDEDAEKAARRLVGRTARPVLTDVTIEGDGVIEVAPQHVPDVFAGAPIVCGVKLSAEGGEMSVRGKLASGAVWERKLRVPATDPGGGNQAIVALFGREHVADLEMRWTIGRETEAIDRTIERVGVVFQIATRRTSWVAIDDVSTTDPTSLVRLVVQPQELPHGTSMQSFGLGAGIGASSQGMTTQAGSITPEGIELMRALAGSAAAAPPRQMRATPPQSAGRATLERPSAGSGMSAPQPAPFAGPAMSTRSAGTPSPKKRRRPSLLVLLLVLFVMIFLGALVWFLFR